MRLNVTVKSWPGGVTISSLAQLSCPSPLPNTLLLRRLISADTRPLPATREPCGLPCHRHPQGHLDKGATQPPSVTRARK